MNVGHLTGEMLIGNRTYRGSAGDMLAFDPTAGEPIQSPVFGAGTLGDVDAACRLAADAFDAYRSLPIETRARFLERIAAAIDELGSDLIERAHRETGLPVARLEGERSRTTNQLKLFASTVRRGEWVGATLDSAQPSRKPLAKPDLRMRNVPVGPVAVFGASNFPLAFSVAGGDTASALAAGCPVVVKAHSAHLGTSELVGRAIQAAAIEMKLPVGVFSLLYGSGNAVGAALVRNPAIKAVGFTGSRQGGLALVDIAAKRPDPIPVFAEMSSINPVFLFPGALRARGEAIASDFVGSLTMGAGQFCTNPGVLVGVASEDLDRFIANVREHLREKPAQTMLASGIHAAYRKGVERLASTAEVQLVAQGRAEAGATQAQAALFVADLKDFLSIPSLSDEVFGPSSVLVRCQSKEDFAVVAEHIEGQLTVTLQLEASDAPMARSLLPVLERKTGRILANGFPTGVEVSHAMVHGGPFPATSDSHVTSVGTTAISRFLRPVCYQDFPAELLSPEIADENPWGLLRRKDGELVRG